MRQETHPLVALVRADRARGAGELARWCVDQLAHAVRASAAPTAVALHAEVSSVASSLRAARPSMVAIENLVGRWLAALPDPTGSEIGDYRQRAVEASDQLVTASRRATAAAARHAARLIGPDRTIMTHSRSATVLMCFQELAPNTRAITTESRPPAEGRVLAQELSALGIVTDFLSDQQMAAFVGHADVALVGADTVTGDGSVVNKAGTRLLALAARDRGIPFYVCYEALKRTERSVSELVLESHDPGEVATLNLPHVTVRNVYFDVTPPELVTAWIDEDGPTEAPSGDPEGGPARSSRP